MKRIIAFLLVAMMVMSMAACGTKANTETKGSEATTTAKVEEPATALEVLENTWAKYAEDEKCPVIGGFTADGGAAADNAPGNVDMTTSDYLQYNLLVPADNVSMVTDCASMLHNMNANFFTCGAYKVTDADAFVTAMQTAIQGNRWMCGFPDKLVIANVGGVIVVAFGLNENMNPFQTHLTEAYAGAEVLVNEAIG